jgi:type VI protein secretion system component VasF
MNDLRRIELHSSTGARPSPAHIRRKVATWFLAAFILSVTIVWFGFLGWGAVSLGQWLITLFSLIHF